MTTTTARKPLTDHDRLTILKYLSSGRDLDFTSEAMQLSRDEVLDVASQHGWPNLDNLAKAAGVIQTKLDRQALDAHKTPRRLGDRVTPPNPVRPAAPRTPTSPAPAAPAGNFAVFPRASEQEPNERAATTSPAPVSPIAGSLDDLVARGRQSDTATTRNLAERLLSVSTDLQARLRTEDETRAARAQAERERTEVQAEVDRLTAALDAAKAKLKPPGKPKHAAAPKAASSRTKQIRAWAVGQGIPVKVPGVIPVDLVARYDEAQST